jgi:succinate-semialdehyde dehydrogenase / glutarate-semialdehyde dehydrogenase
LLKNIFDILHIKNIYLNNMTSVQISTNPYNNSENKVVQCQSHEEVNAILQKSKKAKLTWGVLPLQKRLQYMDQFKKAIENNADELAKIIALEIGCPIIQTMQEVTKSAAILDYYIKNGSEYIADEIIVDTDKELKKIVYSPAGTLLHIAPYNYPLYLALRPIIPSLLVGNTNILKTSSQTPMIGEAIMKLAAEANLPEGVLQVIFVKGGDCEWIIEDESINVICLIGSEKAGAQVAQFAGKCLKKTLMELGGSDPMVIFQDADISKAIDGVMASRLRNAGQSCNAAKRYIVHNSIIDTFTEQLITRLRALIPGDPTDKSTTIGPLANQAGLETALMQIKNSVAQGAKLIYGGTEHNEYGCFMLPAVLRDVTINMPVMAEEVFAPVLPVIGFDNIEEAISIANASEYGLGASVFTQDKQSIATMILELETGNVAVNGIVRGDPMLPFGGVKKSGYGREFGKVGVHELANIKSVHITK